MERARGKERYDLIQWQRRQMIEYSERMWCAGWMSGLEEQVWWRRDVEADMIRDVAEQTGVWWISDREYISLDDWKQRMGEDTD